MFWLDFIFFSNKYQGKHLNGFTSGNLLLMKPSVIFFVVFFVIVTHHKYRWDSLKKHTGFIAYQFHV